MTTMSTPVTGAEAPPQNKRWQDNALVKGWLVILLAVAFGAVLAAVELTLGPAAVT